MSASRSGDAVRFARTDQYRYGVLVVPGGGYQLAAPRRPVAGPGLALGRRPGRCRSRLDVGPVSGPPACDVPAVETSDESAHARRPGQPRRQQLRPHGPGHPPRPEEDCSTKPHLIEGCLAGTGLALTADSAATHRGLVTLATLPPGRRTRGGPGQARNRSRRQVRPDLLRRQVGGVPGGPVLVLARTMKKMRPPRALLVLDVGGLRTPERAGRSAVDANAVSAASIRPGSRVVTSWTSHVLPSGSVKEKNDP
jgi:hypothetical protein